MTDFAYYYLNRERTGYHLMLLIMGLMTALMIPNDFKYIHLPGLLAAVIVLRVINIICLLMLFLALYKNWGNRIYQTFILALFLPVFLLTVILDLTRPRDYLFSYNFFFMLIGFYYFTLPANLPAKIVPPLLITGYQLCSIWFLRDYEGSARLVITSVFIGLNAFGIINATAMRRLRSAELRYHAALQDEARFKKALAESSWDALLLVKEGRVVDYNQKLPDLLGVEGADLHGRLVRDMLALPENSEAVFAARKPVQGTLSSAERSVPVEVHQRKVALDGVGHIGLLLRDLSQDIIDSLPRVRPDAQESIKNLPLSEREKEIVSRIVDGQTRYRIADALFISDETVKTHTNNIYRKLGIRSKVDLVRLVIGR